MATEAWKGFIHSWHTLGIVLKWMCMTVVGIPLAFATCVLVALAALAFGLLCIGAAVGACALVFYILKGTWLTIRRIPYWIEDIKIFRAERRLMRLPIANARGLQLEQWNGQARCIQRPVQMVPSGYMPGPGDIQPPPKAHLRAVSTEKPAGPVGDLQAMIECLVCFEEKKVADFPARPPTSECGHKGDTCCVSCLQQSIASAFESNIWDDIRCPICNLQLQHNDVAEFASPEIFERYDTLSTRRALENDVPNFRWCLGPNCTFGQEHPESPTEEPISVCSSCGFVSCAHHNIPWHSGENCEEYDTRVKAGADLTDRKSQKTIKRIAKRCPGCQRYINKNGGCQHMSCLCGKQFCWHCLADYPHHSWGCVRRG
ncbi:hypothetical protein ONS95_008533 [Cadophora gregata]|uniref:uncharacterized protein n=1 Tax=Cadophora gregata TaxID=51156 RepID=UPI0026DCFF67|nr:uncharacterized protein ONS95_008533 [Cadophora gregata]KAK0100195.1 hypothetical protein ONS95_008533 [Cadophora gregata]KAK0114856.1 hypothetical protein ONS96_013337 [Cadophora gregata f. sp. sojae]